MATDRNVEDPATTAAWERDKHPPLVERFPDLTDDELDIALAASSVERAHLRQSLALANRRTLSLAVEKTRRRTKPKPIQDCGCGHVYMDHQMGGGSCVPSDSPCSCTQYEPVPTEEAS